MSSLDKSLGPDTDVLVSPHRSPAGRDHEFDEPRFSLRRAKFGTSGPKRRQGFKGVGQTHQHPRSTAPLATRSVIIEMAVTCREEHAEILTARGRRESLAGLMKHLLHDALGGPVLGHVTTR